jgi:hypothetical protein
MRGRCIHVRQVLFVQVEEIAAPDRDAIRLVVLELAAG